jgi:hypothetical protein
MMNSHSTWEQCNLSTGPEVLIGTNGKLLVWGADSSPPIIGEMMQHFIERMGLQDDHGVPGCLVINVYKEETHQIEWHSDEHERWGAMDIVSVLSPSANTSKQISNPLRIQAPKRKRQ